MAKLDERVKRLDGGLDELRALLAKVETKT
jgi:hypothetical protein